MKSKRNQKEKFKVVKKRRKKFEPLHRRIATLFGEIQDEVLYYQRIVERCGGIKKADLLEITVKDTVRCLKEFRQTLLR